MARQGPIWRPSGDGAEPSWGVGPPALGIARAVSARDEQELNELTDAIQSLAGQTRSFVQRQFEAAEREVVAKLKESEPALGAVAGATLLGTFALASSYRLTVRVIEKALPPIPAALLATAGFGAGATWCAVTALEALRRAPAPLPSETARAAAADLEEAAREGR